MYINKIVNESCETRQMRRVVVVTSEKYYSFIGEPIYVSKNGDWKEQYADNIKISSENKYAANLIKPFKDQDDIHIVYREISTQKYAGMEPLKDVLGEYYVIYDSLRNDCDNRIKIPYHLDENAIFEKILNSIESIFSITFEETDYHKEKVIVNAEDLFKIIKDQKKRYSRNRDNQYNEEQNITSDTKEPSSKEMNDIEESDKKQENLNSSTLFNSLKLIKIKPIKNINCFIDKVLENIGNRFFSYIGNGKNIISDIKTIDEINNLLVIYSFEDVKKIYYNSLLGCGKTYYYITENSYKIETLDYELTGTITNISIDDKNVSVLFKITDYKPVFQKGDK